MKKTIITSLFLMICFQANAFDNDNVRVMLQHKTNQIETITTTQENLVETTRNADIKNSTETCIDAGKTGFTWCLPVKNKKIDLVINNYSENGQLLETTRKDRPAVSSISLPRHGLTDSEIYQIINNSGLYQNIQLDYEVKSFNTNNNVTVPIITKGKIYNNADYDLFNDEWYHANRATLFRVGDTAMSSGLASVMARHEQVSDKQSDIFVIDGGFSKSDDIPYDRTVNMVYWGDTSRYNDPIDISPRGDVETCSGHGLAVAGTAAADRDNEIGNAGIAGNANLTALRSLVCGTGGSADAMDSVSWLAGNPVDGHDNVYTGNPGVINMSLGGQIIYGPGFREGIDSPCGYFMQQAVDTANEAGFIVVVAAGNDSADAWNITPANCWNVITVGSIDPNGELAFFSNTGDVVDVFAPGQQVYAEGTPYGQPENVNIKDNNGTSFSAPIVAGLIAETKRHFDFTWKEAKLLIKQTAFDPTLRNSQRCENQQCGSGRIDGEEFFLAMEAWSQGRLNTISHALSNLNESDQNWYLNNFDHAGNACSSYQLDFFNGNSQVGQIYKVFMAEKGASFTLDNAVEIGDYTSGSVIVPDLEPEINDYAFQVCTSTGCEDEFYQFNTDEALKSNTPSACNS